MTNLFNVILRTHKYKGGAEVCGNYNGIKLLSYMMKLWEIAIKRRIRQEAEIREN